MTGRVRVFIASSVDGFIAGPGDDLSWLPQAGDSDGGAGDALGYEEFIAQVGAILMGRRTYEVVRAFDGPWPYGSMPVLVATTRELRSAPPGVRRAIGEDVVAMVTDAKTVAAGKDVYVDGGQLIRHVLDAGLVDELILTIVPQILGDGVPLFAGVTKRHELELVSAHEAGRGMMELTYCLRSRGAGPSEGLPAVLEE